MNFSPEKLLLVGIIALVVLGPTRLPQAARTLGRFFAEMRRMSSSFQSEVRDALAEPRDALTGAMSELGLNDVRQSVHEGVNGFHNGITSSFLGDSTSSSTTETSYAAPPALAPEQEYAPAPEDPSHN